MHYFTFNIVSEGNLKQRAVFIRVNVIYCCIINEALLYKHLKRFKLRI